MNPLLPSAVLLFSGLSVLLGLLLLLGLFLLWRTQRRALAASSPEALNAALGPALDRALQNALRPLSDSLAKTENALRDELARQRAEQSQAGASLRQELSGAQSAALAALSHSLDRNLASHSKALDQNLQTLSQSLDQNLRFLADSLRSQFRDVTTSVETRLSEIRKTVEEKLDATLETRLGESFRLVSERLDAVHQGLDEMKTLGAGVGDLKKVLSNVKSRGILGEILLGNLLEQFLTPEQYQANACVKRGSQERVEFAVKLPGQDGASGPVYLPIDSKLPLEDYLRLQDAQDAGDAEAAALCLKQLEARIKTEGKSIRDKYINPPETSDFAILFLPIEGLFAEVLRRPGLHEYLQRECKVTVCGPTNLAGYLNSLSMGFRTLAVQKKTHEVWNTLGTVKTEFGRFSKLLETVKDKLETATRQIDLAASKSRTIEKKLRGVEALPEAGGEEVDRMGGDLEGTGPAGTGRNGGLIPAPMEPLNPSDSLDSLDLEPDGVRTGTASAGRNRDSDGPADPEPSAGLFDSLPGLLAHKPPSPELN